MNACKLLPALSQRQHLLDVQKAKKFTELLPWTFAMYDCRQLEDVTSIENFHMGTEILPTVFIRCCHPHLLPLISIVPQAFGALELMGPLYMTPNCMQ